MRTGRTRISAAVDGGQGTVRDVLLGRLVAGSEDTGVRGSAHVEFLAVEVVPLEAQHFTEPQPAIAEHAQHRLMSSAVRCEAVHLGEAEYPRRAGLAADAGIVRPHTHAADEVHIRYLVSDRVLRHGGQRAQDVLHAGMGAALHREEVVYQLVRVAPAQLPEGPVGERPAFQLDFQHA
jgi:hypothetical protein